MPLKGLPHVKHVRSRGRDFYYFNTGQKTAKGHPIRVRLPDLTDPHFGTRYAILMGQRTRRKEEIETVLLVPQLVALYRKSPKWNALRPASRRLYDDGLDKLCALLPTAPAGEVTPKDIVRLMDDMAEKPGIANAFLRTVGALYKWGRMRGHVPRNCIPTLEIEQFEMGEHEPWPEHVLRAALTGTEGRGRLAVHFLYYTAQRSGDVRKLRWSDIRGDVWYHVQEKTGRPLAIPLHADLRAEIGRYRPTGIYVFQSKTGPLGETTFSRMVRETAADMGVKVVVHGLRKNAVNALLEAGCSAAETAAISGQSLQMIEHYAKRRDTAKLGGAAILKWETKR